MLALLMLCGALSARAGHAASYNPALAIGEASIRAAGARSTLTLAGEWEFDDILQINYPLTIVVMQGTRFVRIPVGGGATSGTFDGLADGLQSEEIAALEAAGAPDPAARHIRLEPRNMELLLPTAIGEGLVQVVLYVVLQHELPPDHGRLFVSNTVAAYLSRSGN